MWKASKVYRRIPGFRMLKRAWRSRGFGIHSPFAFRFVTRVLRERGEYYAYGELRRVSRTDRDFAELSLLFRLVCALRPSVIGVCGELGVRERKTISLADSRVRITGMPDAGVTPGLLYVSAWTEECAEAVRRVFDAGGAVICSGVSAGTLDAVRLSLVNGMTFTNGTVTILISRHDLPRQDFEVNF